MTYLEHHGVKGQRWGVRKDPNKNYSDTQYKRDQSLYGRRAANRINKRMNEGYDYMGARHKEVVRRDKIAKGKRIAKKTAAIAGVVTIGTILAKPDVAAKILPVGKDKVMKARNAIVDFNNILSIGSLF